MDDTPVKRTALVVEDEILFRIEVCDLLAEEGYATVEAATALERLDDAVCLVVTDIYMPGIMNGLGLAREVVRSRPDVAVVVVLARTTPTSGELPKGAPFIGRPFLERRIRAAIRAAVEFKKRPRS